MVITKTGKFKVETVPLQCLEVVERTSGINYPQLKTLMRREQAEAGTWGR